MYKPPIYLDANQVPKSLRGNYTGRKFKVCVCESVTIPMTAGLWDGGSRDIYRGLEIATGESRRFGGQDSAPWENVRADRTVALRPGFAVIEETIMQGKDLGWTFYLHPADAVPMLPAPVELSAVEKLVLDYTATRKSSYMGKDRYQMFRDDMEYSPKRPDFTSYDERMAWVHANCPSRAEWDEAKSALISRGLLNRAGAITPAGRNAR